jgi:hypothetical protein
VDSTRRKRGADLSRGRVSVIIDCQDVFFVGGRGGGWVYGRDGQKVKQYKGDAGKGHFQNFIDGVRSWKTSELHAPVEQGHQSAALAHMANISYRVGSKMSPGELREHMQDDRDSLDALERYSAQMAEWNIDVQNVPWTAGASLGYDPQKERFAGRGAMVKKANKLLHREDRAPYIVPKKV